MANRINQNPHKLSWTGHQEPNLDIPQIYQCGRVSLGCYGGNSKADAKKNEDAAFILTDKNLDWTFAALFDAHNSSESALLMLDFFEKHSDTIIAHLAKPISKAFIELEKFIVSQLLSDAFLEASAEVQGETAMLLCVQKGNFVWWLSVGDNLIYLLHPELANLGQYVLNQRHFYQWIGQVNSLALPVPTYSRGVSELRKGINTIVLLTDGVLEFENSPYTESELLYELCYPSETFDIAKQETILKTLLQHVHDDMGRDSATVISFNVDVGDYIGAIPSNQ